MSHLFILLATWVSLNSQAVGPHNISGCDFKRLFHKLGRTVSTTTLRKELKVVVTDTQASEFLHQVETALGDDKQTDPKKKKMVLRETPDSPDEVYFTQTEYLPKFQGIDENAKPQFNGVIRIRNYIVAPVESTSQQVSQDQVPKLQKLVDQPGEYAKLEFKMGHTEVDSEGKESEVPGVIQKPTLTLLRSDIDLLLQDLRTYEAQKEEIYQRARDLTASSKERTYRVNDNYELRTILDRIGEIHRAGFSLEKLNPAYQTLYQRTARRIKFDDFEVQITVDKDVRVKQYETGAVASLPDNQRIIELKIPTTYAELSDDELTQRGLSELAKIRELYLSLAPIPGTEKGQGKRSLSRKKSLPN